MKLRFNDNPFITKTLRKAIMRTSKLNYYFFHKTKAKEDWGSYKNRGTSV